MDAFISYSYAADYRLAFELERGLQRLARPWNRLRAISVFRGQSDLSLTPHLWPTIVTALDGARWFVLLASPASAASPWVGKEITHWCESKGVEQILLVLTDGELDWDDAAGDFSAGSTALNPALRGRFSDEPLHLDLRWAREAELSLSLSRFRAAVAQVASPIRGMPPDEIEGEDIRLLRRARRLARTAVSALAVLTVAAVVAATLAVVYGRRAEERAREATGRLVGQVALELPASDLDQALLLTLAAAELDDPQSDKRFRPARTMIGRRYRLERLLPAPADEGQVSLRAIALTPDGDRLVATASRADASTRLIDWDLVGSRPPRVVEVPVPGPLQALPGGSVLVGAPGESARVVDPDGAVRSLGQRVLAVDEVGGRVVVVDAAGSIGLVDLSDQSGAAGSTDTIVAAGTGATDGAQGDAAEGPLAVADTRAGAAAVLTTRGLVVRADDGRSASAATASAVAVAVTADGAITASADGQLTRWRIEGTRLIAGRPVAVPAWLGAVRRLVPAPGGERVLAVGRSGTAVLDLASGALLGSDRGLVGPVSPDPSGRYVAVGGARLTLWDLDDASRVLAVPASVRQAAWSGPCDVSLGCRLVTVGESVDVWEPVSGRRILLEDQTNATAVAFVGDRVATAGWGDTAAIWSGSSTGIGADAEPFTGRRARLSGTLALVEGGGEPTLAIDVGQGSRLVLGGSRLLVVSASTVRAVDAVSGAAVALDPKCSGDLVAVSPDGALVATHRITGGATYLCRLDTGVLVSGGRLRGAGTPAAALAVEDSGAIALGGAGVVARHELAGNVWNPGVAIDVNLGGEAFDVRSLSARAGMVAAGLKTPSETGERGRALVWDAGRGSPAVFFEVDQVDVPAVRLLGEQAELVAVAGRDSDGGQVTITVWESARRIRIGRTLLGLSGELGMLSGNAAQVYGTDTSGSALRWPLGLDPHDDICGIVGRAITEQEWESAVGRALGRYPYRPLCP